MWFHVLRVCIVYEMDSIECVGKGKDCLEFPFCLGWGSDHRLLSKI